MIWRSDDNEYFGQNDATPLIVDDTLYIPAGKSGKGKILVAVDKLTGKLRWSVADPQKRPDTYGSSASPAYQIIDGIPQIVCGVYGSTREAWAVRREDRRAVLELPDADAPLADLVAGRVRLTGGPVRRARLGGVLGLPADVRARRQGVRTRQIYRSEKNQVNMYNTVAVFDGAVLGSAQDPLQCTSLEDGRLLWEQAGGDWGMDQSLIVADGLIFALTKKGDLILAEAQPDRLQGTGPRGNRIKPGIPQQPTLANGRLYVRGDTSVVCYDVLNTKN